jgi:selT/selW/selH-like putative selenoprotein
VSAEIIEATDASASNVTLIASRGGVFDVVLDGKKIFSKFESGRFPAVNEILELV